MFARVAGLGHGERGEGEADVVAEHHLRRVGCGGGGGVVEVVGCWRR